MIPDKMTRDIPSNITGTLDAKDVLKGKHALVTGGGTGVGAAIAVHLAEQGAKVTITGRRTAPLRETADKYDNMAWVACDVTSQTAVGAGFEAARAAFGPIAIVVANAGAANSVPFHKLTGDGLRAMLDVNLTGVFNTFKEVQAEMTAAGWGRMIVIASTAGLKGYAYVSAYSAAKHAAIGLTRSLALEVARQGITVNAVCPSFVDTPMSERTIENIRAKTGRDRASALKALTADNPQGRLIRPQEVANTVAFLCGEQAACINGQAIALSGGGV